MAANDGAEGAGGPNPEETVAFVPGAVPIVVGSGGSGTADGFSFLEPAQGEGEIGRLGDYRVIRPIGQGGMGLVFLAEDTGLLRPVALKVIRPDLAGSEELGRRFLREARAVAAIRHENVVTIYAVGQRGGLAYFAMEHLQGTSLERWLGRGKTPSVDLIYRIGREVASGLAAAHAVGMVHRDVKPGNIWLEAPHGRVKLLDFGQAHAGAASGLGPADDPAITRFGAILGTPAFMAPEQARGEPVDPQTDLFSLGVVLYRLATGRLPFDGPNIIAVLTALATADPARPRSINPAIPPALDDLILRLLSKDRGGRPESASAVVEAIRRGERQLTQDRQAADLGSILTRPEPSPDPVRPEPARRQAGGAGLVGLVGVAAVLVGGWIVLKIPRANRPLEIPAREVALADPPAETRPEPTPPRAPVEAPRPPAPAPDPRPIVEPKPVTSPPTPPAPGPVGPSPSPLPGPTEVGRFIDPDGDCQGVFDREAGRATIVVPGGSPHLLSAEVRERNAPRFLRPIVGDFEATVRVLGTNGPKGPRVAKEYAPYHGGGFLLWQDADNYVRLEIAADVRQGKPFPYVNFEYRQAGQLAVSRGQAFGDGSTFLRLTRVGAEVRAGFSPDGTTWTGFPTLPVTLSDRVDLGPIAINSASNPLRATFDGFRVAPIAP